MKITNVDIARCGLCTEGAVRAAISSGRIDGSLESVLGFCLAGRVKEAGLGFADGLIKVPKTLDGLKAGGLVKPASELEERHDLADRHWVPDEDAEPF